MEKSEKIKRVIISLPEKKHADFKIRLRYDELTQTRFFRAVAEGYITQDELLVQFIENYKTQKNLQSKHKKKKIAKARDERSETIRKFALNELEIDNIYDIAEEEHPDL
jgi:hypothetical protein